FRISELAYLEFRTEVFNLFNTTNFANPPATLPNVLGTGTNQLQPGQPYTAAAAGTFGIVNNTVAKTVGLGANRQVQFELRLDFWTCAIGTIACPETGEREPPGLRGGKLTFSRRQTLSRYGGGFLRPSAVADLS